jgi:hypothetical protein
MTAFAMCTRGCQPILHPAGRVACFAACLVIYEVCLEMCPSYEFTGKAYCVVQSIASNCKFTNAYNPPARWCVRCPSNQPQNASGLCPTGQRTVDMIDAPPAPVNKPLPPVNSPTCKVTWVFVTPCCDDCRLDAYLELDKDYIRPPTPPTTPIPPTTPPTPRKK